ncbi:hypothetical protein V6U90_06555 [Micromonospora sp. CPCC 206060]|uniref:hypothetical protein n=1 Tax=Micromonospora sp. CPCC 206060 TaxID=3122406 RepID=UPI002FEFF8AF
MTGLPATDYHELAGRRVAEARGTLAEHVVSTYTGLCLGCGRPGPCDDLRAALDDLARYGPPAAGEEPNPTTVALAAVRDGLDELRTTCASIVTATDRAGSVLHGTNQAGNQPASFPRAIVDAWAALGAVYAGLDAARQLPEAPSGNIGMMLAGLRAARDDADRAAALATGVRLRLTVAVDRLTRTGSPAGLVAARRLGAAIARLDLVTARLAVGGRALDRYAAVLGHAGSPGCPALPTPLPPVGSTTDIRAGAFAAGRLVAAARRRRQFDFWSRVRHQLCMEARR